MNSIPDLLRLLAVPAFGWAALRDVETRRVPDETWLPLAALAVLLLAWEGAVALNADPFRTRWFAVRAGVSLGVVAPLALAFWWFRAFGGADAKAFVVVAALFPTFPAYHVLGWSLPVQPTTLGVFSLTVLTNTVLLGAAYPLALVGRNVLAGRVSPAMVVGTVVRWDAIPSAHGRLLETPSGFTRRGVDLDAIRMYLRWRDTSLAALRDRPETLRDPSTLPAEPGAPGDGAVADGGSVDDPWGAAAFLDDLDHDAYGTTPEALRDGLEVLVARDEVWISPGIPFIVPLFGGLVVGLTYGDLLFGALVALGAV